MTSQLDEVTEFEVAVDVNVDLQLQEAHMNS